MATRAFRKLRSSSAESATEVTIAAPTSSPSPTEKELDEAKEEDSERGASWFYVEAEGGFFHGPAGAALASVPASPGAK